MLLKKQRHCPACFVKTSQIASRTANDYIFYHSNDVDTFINLKDECMVTNLKFDDNCKLSEFRITSGYSGIFFEE